MVANEILLRTIELAPSDADRLCKLLRFEMKYGQTPHRIELDRLATMIEDASWLGRWIRDFSRFDITLDERQLLLECSLQWMSALYVKEDDFEFLTRMERMLNNPGLAFEQGEERNATAVRPVRMAESLSRS